MLVCVIFWEPAEAPYFFARGTGGEGMSIANNAKTAGRPGFKPGKSGNPSGRPKKTEPERKAEELFRKKTPQAAKELLAMADDTETSAKVRVDIYKYVLDRVLGKPRMTGEINVSGDTALTIRWEEQSNDSDNPVQA
jgi:hypothetical protein